MVFAYLGDGAGGFSASRDSFFTSERWNDRLDYGDFDGDGNLDLVSRQESRNMYIHRGLGDGYFAAPQFVFSGMAPGRSFLNVVDLNNDGKSDIVCTNGAATSAADNMTVRYLVRRWCAKSQKRKEAYLTQQN